MAVADRQHSWNNLDAAEARKNYALILEQWYPQLTLEIDETLPKDQYSYHVCQVPPHKCQEVISMTTPIARLDELT